MKFLALFAALAAVAIGAPSVSHWTLYELSAAIENPATSPALVPYLEDALNEMMENLFAGQQMESIAVSMPVMDVSTWTLGELSDALQDPSTDPALVPYLEHALNAYMDALFSGNQIDAITVITPAGIIPAEPSPVAVGPAIVPEVVPEPAVIPEPVVVPQAPAASPLVQIIVNVNQPASSPAAPPAAAIIPEEVSVPEPVQVVDVAEDNEEVVISPLPPSPILIVEPEPVQVVEPVPANPIDIIAVGAPEVNPVDIISPVVPVPSPAIDDVVGPIV